MRTRHTAPAARRVRRALLIALLGGVLLIGCSGAPTTRLTLTGSTSMTPFVEHLAELYQHDHSGVAVDVQGLGSSAGIRAAAEGVSELGMSSRALTDEETGQLDQLLMARDALAIIVHPSNPVKSLTSEQIRAVFTGRVTNWSELGGNAKAIVLVSREAGSGTYTAFEELVMEGEPIALTSLRQGSNGAVRQIVADDADAIGYISLGIVDSTVQPVAIDQVAPSVEAVEEGSYLLVRPFLIVWRKGISLSPLAQEFLGYVQSPEGRAELARGGLVPGGDAP